MLLLGCGITGILMLQWQNYTDILENSLSVSYKAKTMLAVPSSIFHSLVFTQEKWGNPSTQRAVGKIS